MSPYMSFLYAEPSALEGVARILDFAGALNTYNLSARPDEADARALYADWCAVGDDLRTAMAQFSADVSAQLVQDAEDARKYAVAR